MKFVAIQLICLIGACLALVSCEQDFHMIRPYEDPTARLPESFKYLCPDYESERWECPFDEEPTDKVVFSGPRHLDGSGSVYEPSDFNYDLFYDSLRLIDSVPPGETLYATTFYFSPAAWGVAMQNALLCAVARGVNVELIVGNPIEPDDNGELKQHKPTQETLEEMLFVARSYPQFSVHGCTGGCLSDDSTFDGKQHSKFIAASRSCNGRQDSEYVVAVSSNNWTSSLVKRDNATIIKRDDEKLYNAFKSYFESMVAAETKGLHLKNYYDTPDGNGGFLGSGSALDRNYEYHLFPRAEGPDPVRRAFADVPCEGDAEIRISMSRWSTARQEIVDTLVRKANQGCRVRIIVGEEEHPAEVKLRKYIIERAERTDSNFEYRSLPSPYYHDKYFMIERDSPETGERQRYVWAGSHNFSKSSLYTNEESSLGVYDADLNEDGIPDNQIYDDFVERFDFQWQRAGLVGQFLPE